MRDGKDRGSAARMIGRTGTQIKRMCNPDAQVYDADLHTGYLRAVAERDEDAYRGGIRPPSEAETPTVTPNGHKKAAYLEPAELDGFLDDVASGIPRVVAARTIGTTFRQIERRANSDPEFAVRLAEAYEHGYPHYQEWLRAKAVDFIEGGNYNALRDQLLIHLPEAEKLRVSKHEIGGPGGGPIKMVQAVLADLPPEILGRVIEALEEKEQKALEQGEAA